MAFVINPKREVKFYHTITQEKENIEFSVTFRWVASEDTDYVTLRDKAADKTPLEVIDEKTGAIKTTNMGTYNAFIYTLRTSLIDCEGITDLDGNIIKIKDEKGKIIEDNQIAVFEAVRSETELFNKICLSYIGEKEKNL